MSTREEILKRVEAVPALPTSTARVFELLDCPDVAVSELLLIAQHDPALTGNALRLANSAAFAQTDVTSLRDAFVRLGNKQAMELIVASAVVPLESSALAGYDLIPGQLLQHAIAVAVGTEELGKALHLRVPAYTFTAGVLHDIGKTVLSMLLEVEGQEVVDLAYQDGIPFEEAERKVLGTDHAEVGAHLLAHWQLPAAIVETVRWHHQPDGVGYSLLRGVDLVHVADTLALAEGIGAGIDGLNYRPSAESLSRLKMNMTLIERVMCATLGRLDSLSELLGIGMERS